MDIDFEHEDWRRMGVRDIVDRVCDVRFESLGLGIVRVIKMLLDFI